MSKHYFDRLEYLDELIRRKSTGNPAILAQKFNVSKRTIFEYLDILKSQGADIDYCRYRESYYYKKPGYFSFKFNLLSYLIAFMQIIELILD